MPQSLTFAKFGDQPSQIVNIQQHAAPTPEAGEVLIKWLVAAINPQDLMVLRGTYPVKPENHIGSEGIPGYDGVAEVLQCGEGVTALHTGDRVIPKRHGLGTWRTHAVLQEASLMKISCLVDPKFCATLRMGVTPAYLLLEDMKQLKPGDWIIQNAASGVIAQMVSQFAPLRGLHTISVIRDRADEESSVAMKKKLQGLGADLVVTHSELSCMENLSGHRRIMLGLDSVFGPSAAQMATHLSPGALFVNYGSLGMHGQSESFSLTQEMLFWKGITFRKFRLSESLASRSEDETRDMLDWFVNLFRKGALKAADTCDVVWDTRKAEVDNEATRSQLSQALVRAEANGVGEAKKQLIVFSG